MIGKYTDISKRNLLINKKRTILVSIGIILSVSLITAMATFLISVQKYNIEGIREYRDYHVLYKNINEKNKNVISKYGTIEKYCFYNEVGEYKLGHEMVQTISTDIDGIEVLGYKLVSGRLPKSSNEIVIDNNKYCSYGRDIEVGTDVTLMEEENEIQYTVVGIIEKKEWNGPIAVVFNDKNSQMGAIVKIKEDSRLRKNIDKLNEVLKKDNNSIEIEENDSLLSYLGASEYQNINSELYIVIIILISIVVISTIVMISNAFNITVTERLKEFGLLKAIGTTPSQIRTLVFIEATIIAFISIPIGIIIGYLGLKLVLILLKNSLISELAEVNIILNIKVILIVIIIGIVTVYLSALSSTIKAGRVSPLECINSSTVNIKRVPRGRIINKIFRIEGLLAFRNRKINRNRYYVTIVSMSLSIALFISISTSLTRLYGSMEEVIDPSSVYDMEIMSMDNSEDYSEIKEKLLKCKEVKDIKDIRFGAEVIGYVDEGKTLSYSTYEDRFSIDDNTLEAIPVEVILIDKSYESWIKTKIDNFSYGDLVKEKGVISLDVKCFDSVKGKYVSGYNNIHKGDNLYLSDITEVELQKNSDIGKGIVRNSLKKANIMYNMVCKLGRDTFISTSNGIIMIIPIENWKEIHLGETENIKLSTNTITSLGVKLKDNLNKEQLNIVRKSIKDEFGDRYYIDDFLEDKEYNNKRIMTVKIFSYSFILIITLISVLNIINTVSTNILLRKRELSSLRAIGTSFSSMRKMLLMEGMMYGIYSSIYGSLLGIILANFIVKQISNVFGVMNIFPIKEILIAVVVSTLLGIVSIIIPLNRLKKVSIIDGIKALD
ncbi:putative membrane protein [Clostridium bornimense]|uniref:Putative membrane protein n=1 Tax=Clostridium bornimense TaxID=1216932 RepID=W6S5J6_9CLOT|nr:FtsX-like permease family protein [Clostridium bornimense]CDM69622.1 putative membrane protein [Clostridium bornimense]